MSHKRNLFSIILLGTALYSTASAADPNVKARARALWQFDGPNGSAMNMIAYNGDLYGTAAGGAFGVGAVYQLTPPSKGHPNWRNAILYNFNQGTDGGNATAPLTFDSKGNIYGTTETGSKSGQPCGTVFKLTAPVPPRRAWGHSVVYRFPVSNNVCPYTTVTYNNGVLYGTASIGGTSNAGTIFTLTPPTAGGTWTLSTIYNFTGGSDGGSPGIGSLAFDSAGNMYGTAEQGGSAAGASGSGVVFELSPPAVSGGSWTESVLYDFAGGNDGAKPESLTFGADGALYGTTALGGGSHTCYGAANGCGTIFRLAPPAVSGGAWTEAVLYGFTGGADGGAPNTGLILDKNGAVYGTAAVGGITTCTISGQTAGPGCGTVFQIASSGGSWVQNTIHQFAAGSDGWAPTAAAFNNLGILVVTTFNNAYNGAAYKFTAAKGGSWTESLMYSFASGSDGDTPAPILTTDSNGSLYGTTYAGGSGECLPAGALPGCGIVFKLIPRHQARVWRENIIYNFTGAADGAAPLGGVAIGTNGVLYGSSSSGGAAGLGNVFQLTPPATKGGPWAQTVLYSFGADQDGTSPNGPLTIDNNGALYGTTATGGTKGNGAVFQLTPPSTPGGAWTESIIYSFQGGADGVDPINVVFNNGNLYGVTYGRPSGSSANFGTVFQLTPPAAPGGAWTETVLHSFIGSDGANPNGLPVFDATGALYGTTAYGGSRKCPLGCGIVYQLMPPSVSGGAWTQNVISVFSNGTDGHTPTSLIFSNGTLYGTAAFSGAGSNGQFFELVPGTTPKWKRTVLYRFTFPIGTGPQSLLVNNGEFYGTASGGGNVGGFGTIFRITP